MNDQIDEIIEKYKDLFQGKETEVESYLKKHYDDIFRSREVIEVRSDDESSRIKRSGFHKNLSSWRNYYENITVSSCVKINGEQKRFDHKFIFVKEKLNAETIDIVEDAIKETDRLKRNFKYDDALAKIEEMIEFIKDEDDRIYNLRLLNVRNDISASKERYLELEEQLNNSKEEFKKLKQKKKTEEMVSCSETIIKIALELKNGPIARQYQKISNDLKKQIEFEKDLVRLESLYIIHRKRKEFGLVVKLLNKLIGMCEAKKNYREYQKKYEIILAELQEEIGITISNTKNLLEEYTPVKDTINFAKSISKIDETIEIVRHQGFEDHDAYVQQLKDKRAEILKAQEEFIATSNDIADLDKKLTDSIKDKKIFLAKSYCQGLIELAEKKGDEASIKKYKNLFSQIEEKIAQLKNKIDALLIASTDLSKSKNFDTALINIDKMLQFMGQDLPEYKEKLQKKREEIFLSEAQYRLFREKSSDLEEKLNAQLEKRDYVKALAISEEIMNLPGLTTDKKRYEQYKKQLNDIKLKIKEIKNKIVLLLKESEELNNNNRFKEALNKIDAITILVGEQDLPEEKKELKRKRNQIIEAQERFIKFADNVVDLEKELANNLKNNNFMTALSNCDILIQVAQSIKNEKLVSKYSKIIENINFKIQEIVNKIQDIINESLRLKENREFDQALLNIDVGLELLQKYDFSEKEMELEDARRDILESQELDEKKSKHQNIREEIDEIDHKMSESLSNNSLIDAISNCEAALELARASGDDSLVEKYSKTLDTINAQIVEIKSSIEDLLKRSPNITNDIEFERSLSNLDEMLKLVQENDLQGYKHRLEQKRKDLVQQKTLLTQKRTLSGSHLKSEKSQLVANSELPCSDCFSLVVRMISDVQKRISDNLKKLHIGVMHNTVNKIIGKIFEEELTNLNGEFMIKQADIQRLIKNAQNTSSSDSSKE